MRFRAVALPLLVFAIVAPPQGASAKGASRAVITGPGVESPIAIGRKGSQDIYTLADLAGVYQLVFETTPTTVVDRQPVKVLGPRYDVAYVFGAPGMKTNVVHQDLYPYARPDPVTHVAPGQAVFRGETTGGWFQAGPALLPFLVSKGLPAPKDAPTADAAKSKKTAEPEGPDDDAAAAPVPPSTPSSPGSSDSLPVALLTGAGVIGAIATTGIVLRRRRLGAARGVV